MTKLGALCAAALLWMAAPAWAGAVLRGVVVREREHGAPMAGVELSAPGANSVTTGNDGQFVLAFPQGHPGQDISVRVSHAGWEVVNDVLLDRPLPEPASTHPFEIIVCASSERELRRMEFYRLKGNQAVEQTYRAKLAEFERRHAATVQERDRLLRERDDARKQVDEWARQAAARKSDEVGGTYKAAFRLFVDGKTDAALQLLSDERLQQEVDQAQAQLQKAAAGWLLRGQLLITKFDYKGAGRAYDRAVAAAPGSAEAWGAYAVFHQRQNHFAQARQGHEKTLILARQASDRALVAWTLNKLGLLNADKNRKTKARENYEEALAIYRSLAVQNPDVHQPDVARTLNNLGILNRDEHRNAEARKAFEEALVIYRTLAVQNPDVYPPDVARTLNHIGLLNADENHTDEARKAFEEALAIYRVLAVHSPDVYGPYVAQTLNNLVVLYSNQYRKAEARKAQARKALRAWAEARKNIEEALAHYRTQAIQNPNIYRPYVAGTLNKLGLLNRNEHRNAEARKDFDEALAIYRALAVKNADTYRPDLARTLNSLGLLNHEEHRNAEARKNFDQALAICRALTVKNPDAYRPDLAQTLDNLGVLNRDENRKDEARKNFDEALAIRRTLAVQNPDAYRPDLAQTLDNLGVLNRNENRNAEARNNFSETLAIRSALAVDAPDVYSPYVARTLNNLGVLNRDENRKDEARDSYQEALVFRLGDEEDRHAEALVYFDEALTIYRALAAQNPDVYQPDVAQTLNNRGLVNRAENRHAEARKDFEEALAIYREFAPRAPATYQPHVQQVEQYLRDLGPVYP